MNAVRLLRTSRARLTLMETEMTDATLEAILETVKTWPPEDQDELIEIARTIEARRTGVYVMSADERAAVEEGRQQARTGEFVSDEDMEKFWKSLGA